MKDPIRYRNGIPFFYDKSESEFSQDIYERYDDMVLRQSLLHLADELWQGYPMQPVLDFVDKHVEWVACTKAVEVGCSVGRLIASLAMRYPAVDFWGLDYSYQLIRRAQDFWIDQKSINLDASGRGLAKHLALGKSLENLQFGLAKAEKLPFDHDSQDLVLSSFLLDRLQDPITALQEMHRVLKADGQMVIVSPLNFTKGDHWQELFPAPKINLLLGEIGFELMVTEENLMVIEPLDVHGNVILWKCWAAVCRKK
jgi:ubiquinone/menaquinone biosynthesis C-methylase UbiE